MSRKIMHLTEVAAHTHVPEATLRYWRHRDRGEGPPLFKIGRRVVAYADEVDAWLQAQRDGVKAS